MIETSTENNGLIITINRPARRNALTQPMYAAMRDALQVAQNSETCNSVILTGAAGHFTAGNDLSEFQGTRPEGDTMALQFLRTLASIDVPVIAAVEGNAVGVGVTLLQHCDFVYASGTSRFSLPFVSLGLCPEGGSSLLMELVAGRRKTAEWLLLGQAFNADDALSAGLINAITAEGQTLNTAQETAAILAQQPTAALRLTKQMLRSPQREALTRTFDAERDLFRERINSAEAQAAFQRFFNRASS